jgi:hypothetical protein
MTVLKPNYISPLTIVRQWSLPNILLTLISELKGCNVKCRTEFNSIVRMDYFLKKILQTLILHFLEEDKVWYVECSRHSRTNTTGLCCRYIDTRRQPLALKRAA